MFNTLFLQRIGIPENEEVTFKKLDYILEKTATTIPFENLGVLSTQSREINKENMMDKVLIQNEGGLCYELNTTFYFFLVENGFDVKLIRGVVYDHTVQKWGTIGRTHVAILLVHNEKTYLVDTGFGGNLPNPKSLFNKHPLITKLTQNGSLTLTDTSFTQWIN